MAGKPAQSPMGRHQEPGLEGRSGSMTPPPVNSVLLLLVANGQVRDSLVAFLEGHEYAPRVVGNPTEALQTLRGRQSATVFVDCQTVSTYGPNLYAKMKVACPHCRVVLLCDRSHRGHRDIVKEAMDLGAYACLLSPFAELEVLTMVRRSQAAKPPGRRSPRPREK